MGKSEVTYKVVSSAPNAVVAKVYKDFITYANKKPKTTKTIKYKGFKAIFSKVATDKYKLTLKYN